MKILPKSHVVRNKILKILYARRMSLGSISNLEQCKMSVKEISKAINEDFDYVNLQLDFLFYKKYIHCFKNEKEILNPYSAISDEGITEFAGFKDFNEGKIIQTQIINNIVNSLFQIVVGVVAIVTIWINVQDSKTFNNEVETIQNRLDSLEILVITKNNLDTLKIPNSIKSDSLK